MVMQGAGLEKVCPYSSRTGMDVLTCPHT
jgi:cystathionine beta-synthase